MLDNFLFIALPYVALVVFFVGTIHRYRTLKYKNSSLSSQFLEGDNLFWGTIPFHWGLIVVLLGHFMAFLIPDTLIAWNGDPMRLIALEITGFAFALGALVGLVVLLLRRMTNDRLRVVSSPMDTALEWLLLAQIILGLLTAFNYRWGSTWFASDMTPYLWSIIKLNPETSVVLTLPLIVRLHIIGAFLIIFLVPFTRLVHVLVAPLHYIGRPNQRVMWNWDRKKIRRPDGPWNYNPPKNN